MHFFVAAILSVLFAGIAIALPVENHARQITPTGTNNYGSDTVPSMTDGSGSIVKFVNPEAGATNATAKA